MLIGIRNLSKGSKVHGTFIWLGDLDPTFLGNTVLKTADNMTGTKRINMYLMQTATCWGAALSFDGFRKPGRKYGSKENIHLAGKEGNGTFFFAGGVGLRLSFCSSCIYAAVNNLKGGGGGKSCSFNRDVICANGQLKHGGK